MARVRMSCAWPLLLAAPGLLMLARATPSFPAPQSARFKSPLGLAVDAGGQVFVTLSTAQAVAVVNWSNGNVLEHIPVDPDPMEIVSYADHLYLAHANKPHFTVIHPERRTVVKRLAPAEVSPLVTAQLQRKPFEAVGWRLPDATNGSPPVHHQLRTFYVHQMARSQVPASQVSQGWVFTNMLATYVGGSIQPPTAVPLDEPQRGFADPSDVVVSPDGARAFVACGGADAVLALDLARLEKWARARAPIYATKPIVHDLTAGRHFVLAEVPTQANPRRLALSGDGKVLVVSNHLADSLTVIDTTNLKVLRHISLGGPTPDAARRGAVLFHSGRLTFQGQFTCASCHPGGGADGLNWDLERDGVGNFKNTKALWGLKDTAPYGWHGSSPTAADRVRGTLRTLHRHEPTELEVNDLATYLESLTPPAPLPLSAEQRPAAERGKKLFAGKGQCSNCHHRAGLDDGLTHDVGTRGPTDTEDKLDTPGLRGVGRTAPYLHDGRAATLEEVFTKHNASQRHGAAHRLSKEELADLVQYLKSL